MTHRSLDAARMIPAVGLALLFVARLGSGAQEAGRPAGADLRVIETSLCTLRLDARTGDLVGLAWKEPRVEVIQEAKLGENFRILLPRPGFEANYFTSRDQTVARIQESARGVTCFYDTLRNKRGTVDMKVRYHIRPVEGRLEFSIEVDNPTDLPLAEVYFGIVGGQQGLVNRLDTESLVPGWMSNVAPNVFTSFRAGGYGGGNLGIRYDAAGFLYPGSLQMGWIEFFNRKAGLGLYYANHDVESRLTGLYLELRPFTKSAVLGSNWPTPADVPPGEPIGLTMGWLKFPYLKRGTFASGPVALQIHRGDWHEGSAIYRAWFDKHFEVSRPPSWLRREMAWQSVIISNSEDVAVWKFKDLPELAAGAKKYGVTTFEILGWDIGGIDRGYPQYRPDPRLGTPAEFRQALAEVKKLGVHPLIFANVQFADTATPLFSEKLRNVRLARALGRGPSAHGMGRGDDQRPHGIDQLEHDRGQPRAPGIPKVPPGPVRAAGRGRGRRIPARQDQRHGLPGFQPRAPDLPGPVVDQRAPVDPRRGRPAVPRREPGVRPGLGDLVGPVVPLGRRVLRPDGGDRYVLAGPALYVSRMDLDDLRREPGRRQRHEQRPAVWLGLGDAAPPLQRLHG